MACANGMNAGANCELAQDCARHAHLLFGSTSLGLATAGAGTFTLVPPQDLREALAKDYAAMTGMVFGNVPTLSRVFESVEKLERALNGGKK